MYCVKKYHLTCMNVYYVLLFDLDRLTDELWETGDCIAILVVIFYILFHA